MSMRVLFYDCQLFYYNSLHHDDECLPETFTGCLLIIIDNSFSIIIIYMEVPIVCK